MAGDPREAWARFQRTLQSAQRQGGGRGFGGGAGSPRAFSGPAAGVALLLGGIWVANQALFNGMGVFQDNSSSSLMGE